MIADLLWFTSSLAYVICSCRCAMLPLFFFFPWTNAVSVFHPTVLLEILILASWCIFSLDRYSLVLIKLNYWLYMCDAAGTLNKLWQIWNQSKYIVRSFTWNLIQFHACLADTVEAKDSIYVSLDAFIDKELQKKLCYCSPEKILGVK
jgi:hypothetical protein